MNSFDAPPNSACAAPNPTPTARRERASEPNKNDGWITRSAPTPHTGNAAHTIAGTLSLNTAAAPMVVTSGETNDGTDASARGRYAAVAKKQ